MLFGFSLCLNRNSFSLCMTWCAVLVKPPYLLHSSAAYPCVPEIPQLVRCLCGLQWKGIRFPSVSYCHMHRKAFLRSIKSPPKGRIIDLLFASSIHYSRFFSFLFRTMFYLFHIFLASCLLDNQF